MSEDLSKSCEPVLSTDHDVGVLDFVKIFDEIRMNVEWDISLNLSVDTDIPGIIIIKKCAPIYRTTARDGHSIFTFRFRFIVVSCEKKIDANYIPVGNESQLNNLNEK